MEVRRGGDRRGTGRQVTEVEGLELDLADELLVLEHVEEVGLVAVVVANDDDDLCTQGWKRGL
jgi:hypothetical protein